MEDLAGSLEGWDVAGSLMQTAFQPNAFQNNAFQIVSAREERPQIGGPGGSNKAGKRPRRRYICSAPANPYQIPWGKNSDVLLDLLPDDTQEEQRVHDALEATLAEQEIAFSNINALLITINKAIMDQASDVSRQELEGYNRKVVQNYRKARRRQEDEEFVCLLICM